MTILPLALETEAVAVSGWAARPRVNRRTARGIHIFVNGRHVRDRTVQHAVLHGYRQRLMKGQYPVVVCCLRVPVGEVDVNVHPAKYEVRFVHQQAVHGAVAGAVHAALASGPLSSRPSRAARFDDDTPAPAADQGVAEAPATYKPLRTPATLDRGLFTGDSSTKRPAASRLPAAPRQVQPQPALWRGGHFAALRVIGQLRSTYIVCESEAGLVLIDQHAAHERIYYEQLKRRAGSRNAARQALLLPETLELDFRAAAVLEAMRAGLGRLGFDIEPFGGNTFIIRAAPDFLAALELGPMLREIVEQAEAVGVKPDPDALREESLQIMACHGAIRARQVLDPRQIRRLLIQLDECDNPSHCPHGRPTWIRWTTSELEKAFGRQT